MFKNNIKIMKVIYFLLIGILFINLISSEQTTLGVFKQNTCVELIQICADCSFVNITSVRYPNSTLALATMIKMTKTGTEYNYSFCNTSFVGKYIVNGFGDVDGTNTIFNYDFEITPSGVSLTVAQGGISIGILISIVVLMFFFGFLSFKFLENDKTFPIGLFFLVLSIIIAVYGLYLGVTYSTDYLYSNTSDVQSKVFIGVLFGLIGITFLGLLFLVLATLAEFKERKSLINYGGDYNSKTKMYK